MSEHDTIRERRQRLLFLMETKGMGHPNYHSWEAEYKALRPKTSAPRNEIDKTCREATGYPPMKSQEAAERREGMRRQNAAQRGVKL
jgi:hypothetical protein